MTIAALTSADTAALEFYQENVAYVDGFGLTNLDRPERLLFKKGRQLMEAALAAANAPATKRIPYTDEEVCFLVTAYLNAGAHMTDTLAAFFQVFPETEHTRSSVWQKIQRIRTLDNAYPDDTRWDGDAQVRAIAGSIAPNRFA
jgi:hypothetical protein